MSSIFDPKEPHLYIPYNMQPGYELAKQKERSKQSTPDKSFKRKLCKSCKYFPCWKNIKPTGKACERYIKK